MSHRFHVLSTASLSSSLVDTAARAGVHIDVQPFIHTVPVDDEDMWQEVAALLPLPVTAVFTSGNAVRAIGDRLAAAGKWSIYCVGASVHAELRKYFTENAFCAVEEHAEALAERIIADNVCEVVFFCGDKRLDILPSMLHAEEISMHEFIVYNTVATPQPVSRSYDGILFFSPSAANSFFSVNTIGSATVLFAIGETTAAAVRAFSASRLLTSSRASKERVVDDAVAFFTQL